MQIVVNSSFQFTSQFLSNPYDYCNLHRINQVISSYNGHAGLLGSNVMWTYTNISKEHTAFTFSVEVEVVCSSQMFVCASNLFP
jgi:hypothetical protein